MVEDLHRLTLVDGIALTREGKDIRYRVVYLRETNVADEREATRVAERVMLVGGVPKLLVSDADFSLAMTMRHVQAFDCDGQRIPQALIDMELFCKLSSHDLGLIQQRVFLITLAAELRYGNITQAQFDLIVAGKTPPELGNAAPQPVGQVAGAGAAARDAEPGPALLADFAGDAAAGQAARAGS